MKKCKISRLIINWNGDESTNTYEILAEPRSYLHGIFLLIKLFRKDAEQYEGKQFRIEYGKVLKNPFGGKERFIQVYEEVGNHLQMRAIYSLFE